MSISRVSPSLDLPLRTLITRAINCLIALITLIARLIILIVSRVNSGFKAQFVSVDLMMLPRCVVILTLNELKFVTDFV